MHEIEVEIRRAKQADIDRIQQLTQQARRICIRFGYEDLVRMIQQEYCFIADTGALLWGFTCATEKQAGLAQLRGISLINGWRVDAGISMLLDVLTQNLRHDKIEYLMHQAYEAWLVAPLARYGFITHDYIVNFERATPINPLRSKHQVPGAVLRSLAPTELAELTLLDRRCFDWPWHFPSGELIKLLLTTSRFVVIEMDQQLAGYACTHHHGEHAQIIRVAVDPDYQGKGLGRLLLADALDFAADNGVRTVTLNTQRENLASQRLYLGFGFRMVGRRVPVMIYRLDNT